MPKKRPSNRLDDLFDNIEHEETTPSEDSERKSSSRSAQKKSPTRPAKPAKAGVRVASTLAQTAALPPLETTAISQPATQTTPATMSLGLQVNEKSWATLQVVDEGSMRVWDENEELLVRQVTDQLGQALENARLFQETRTRAEELAILNEMGRELTTLLDRDEIAACVYKHTSRLMDTTNLFISLYDEKKEEIFPFFVINGHQRVQGGKRKLGKGLSDHILRTREALFLPDDVLGRMKTLGLEVMFLANTKDFAQCWMGAPLLTADTIIGVIGLQSITTPNIFTERHRDILTAIAGRAAIAIENARLFAETQRRAEELAVLNQLTQRLSARLDTDQVLQEIYAGVSRLIDTKNFYIGLYNPDKNEVSFPLNVSESVVDKQIITLRADQGLTGHILKTRAPLLIPENQKEVLDSLGIRSVGQLSLSWLGVPLMLGEQVIGVMAVQSYEKENAYSEHDRDLLGGFAGQAAISIQNARLFTEAQRRSIEISTLAEITSTASQSLDLKIILVDVLHKVFAALQFEAGLVTIFNKKRGKLERAVRRGLPGDIPDDPAEGLEGSLCDYVYQTGQVMAINDLREGAPVDVSSNIEQGFLGYLGVPVQVKGTTIGTLCIFRQNISPIPENTIVLGQSIGNQLGFAIENARLFEETRTSQEALKRRNEYLAATADIGQLVTSTLDLPTLFSRTVNLVGERFGFYSSGIFIIEETGFNAILQASTGEIGRQLKQQEFSLTVGSKSAVGQSTSTGRPTVINDASKSDVFLYNESLPETRSEAVIPLRVGSRVIGALDIQSTQVNAFSDDEITVLQTLADQVAIAIDNARSYELSIQAVKEMREADRLKSQFLANMSHELRTPLNSIIGFSRVILKGIDGPISDLQQQDLLAIHNSGQHLLGLINDILDLSRIEAGKMELTFDEVHLNDLVGGVMSTAAGLVKDKAIQLQREIPTDLPAVRADSMRVRQVLLNLLSNASKFTDEGTITVSAELVENPGGHSEVIVRVTDTGPGIAREDQKKLFQPFSQVDASPTRKTGGSGLGLSISNHLIQMHGGRMGVESETGAGSTFYFTLPTFHDRKRNTTSSDSRVILAIDDDPQVISLYERYLQPQGYEVAALYEPSRAVERALQVKPFAITLDIMMPGYDGWRVLNDLKSNPATRDIPVVVCSIVEEQEKGFSLGAADYLLKPILEEDILGALDRLNSDGSIREVLIVDDDPHALRLIDKMLSEQGRYRPTMAEGGKSGWEAIQSRTPHALILDLFMPDLDGFTILERMRNDPKLRDIPVIVVSGGDLTSEQQDQLREFGQRMIKKGSLTEKELLDTLERALKRVQN